MAMIASCASAPEIENSESGRLFDAAGPSHDDIDWSSRKSSAEILAESSVDDWRTLPPEETLYIKLERGQVIVALSPSLAPNHVAQIRALTAEKFYDGLSFYRVIDGFVAQGGDPFGERAIDTAAASMAAEFDQPLTGQTSFNAIADQDGYAAQVGFVGSIPAGVDALNETVWHLHCTGAFAFGRNNERDSASTEFYIALQPQRYLDRNLTVFGRVVQGMEHLQMMRRVSPPESKDDDLGETILSMRMGSQLGLEERAKLEILDSTTDTFAEYVAARRNRPEEFFYFRPNYVDICQLPVPVRPITDQG